MTIIYKNTETPALFAELERELEALEEELRLTDLERAQIQADWCLEMVRVLRARIGSPA